MAIILNFLLPHPPILTGVNFVVGKAKGNLELQVQSSLKKFQGRKIVSGETKDGVTVDTALINKMKDVLVAQGWTNGKKPEFIGRKRFNTNPENVSKPVNSPNYRGRNIPLVRMEKLLNVSNAPVNFTWLTNVQRKMLP